MEESDTKQIIMPNNLNALKKKKKEEFYVNIDQIIYPRLRIKMVRRNIYRMKNSPGKANLF